MRRENPIASPSRLARLLLIACSAVLAACKSPSASPLDDSSQTVAVKKSRMELRRIERDPPPCKGNGDCPTGSHCDAKASVCKWECIADSDCGPGARCNALGSCMPGQFHVTSDNNSAACQQIDPAERIARLMTLNDDQMPCANGDDACPCGAYCNGLTGVCEVDCIAGVIDLPPPDPGGLPCAGDDCGPPPPPSIPGCGSGQQCTSFGRCGDSPDAGGGVVQALTLQISPPVISGNPASGPVLVPVTVSVTANSLDFLQPNHPAVVRYQFPADGGQPPMPQVKCAPNDALADSCDLSGWAFHVDTGSLVSDPKTIWVQIPQVATATQWTMLGRSDFALTPASAVVKADPVAYPATDPGHYIGAMAWPNGAQGGTLSVPVEAFVTSTAVALYEPSRILLPDGHMVLSRDPAKVTMLGWLTSGSAHYDVRVALAPPTYNATSGQLAAMATYQTGSLRQTSLTLSLQRTGDLGVASCSGGVTCASGTYCDASMAVCLPGTGPAAGAGIVSASTTPSATLASARIAAWNDPLNAINDPSHLLGGAGLTPRELFERPYCFQNDKQLAPATFARGSALLFPSDDLGCTIAGGDQPQLTFGLENQQQEVGVDSGGAAYNLLNDCAADLDAQPTSAFPGANRCASLSRFLLALRSNQPDDFGYRLKTHLLRQWLDVNSYVANTTVKDQAYEDALGVSGQPPSTRFAQALDRMDQDLGLLLDPSARIAYAPDNDVGTLVDAAPDYRFLRPGVRFTFNEAFGAPYTNAETGQTISPCLSTSVTSAWQPRGTGWLGGIVDTTDFPCVAKSMGTLGAPAGMSFVLSLNKWDNKPNDFLLGDGVVEVLDTAGTTKVALLGLLSPSQTLSLQLGITANGNTSYVMFPAISRPLPTTSGVGYGLIAVTKRRNVCTLFQAGPTTPVHVFQIACPDVPIVIPNANVGLGGAYERIDELSVWNRPLSLEEVSGMAAQYYAGFNGQVVATNQTLPAPPNPLPGAEQAAGLPAHMLEAANAELNLAQAYVAASGTDIYTQCLSGGQRTALDPVLARVGQTLRTVSVIEDEAANVVAAVGTTAWLPRYQGDQNELAGRRGRLIATLASLQGAECKNPLGIAEEDLPLYVGSGGSSAAEKFFAGSRYLANAALSEIDVAGGTTGLDGLLAQARSAYNASRTSQFQEAQGAHDSADRILKISTDYEDQLKRFCGAPPGEDVVHGVFPLLAGFKSGAITASSCFLKTELPECAGLANAPLSSVPAECLRGEMGERLLAIQAAIIDAENASHAYDRALDLFASDENYCAQLKIQLRGDEDLLAAHQTQMASLRSEKSLLGIGFGILNGLKSQTAAALSMAYGVPGGGSGGGGIQGVDGIFEAFVERKYDEDIQAEEDAYQAVITARKDDEAVEACCQKADDEKYAIDAARDTIHRATQQTKAAMFTLTDDYNTVAALAAEGNGQLAIEAQIDRTPPHLHYWLDQTISAYNAHMAYARRLTYLAVRAYEYESQQTSNLRDPVLHANLPNDLRTVASSILGATAPFAGRGIDSGQLVLSLRDDVLHIVDLSQQSSRLDGTAPLTPTEGFKALLKSDASKVFDQNGGYVGHGIRFSLRPEAVDAQSCAERITRIMPSVTIENASQEIAHTRVILAATNTFGSQLCGVHTLPTLQLARVQPSQALLVGDAVPTFQNPSAFSTTGLFPLINTSRDTLRTMTFPTDDPSAFAGRGRYGDYILIFPDDPRLCTPALCDGWSIDALDKVDDVLLRFDFVEQDNTQL